MARKLRSWPALALLQVIIGFGLIETSSLTQKDELRKQCIKELQDEYRRVIGPLLKGKFVQLVDMIWHHNLGDCFIEYGEQLFIREVAIPSPVYCSMRDCDYDAIWTEINQRPNNSVVAIHGGGNFGDRYRRIQWHHLELTQIFRDFPVIFLPQSVYYIYGQDAFIDADVLANHTNLLILARDFPSLDYLKTTFAKTPSELCPDSAFMIGPQDSSQCKPKADVFFLKRKDRESRKDLGDFDSSLDELTRRNVSFRVSDWPCGLKKKSLKMGFSKCKNGYELGKECLCDGGRVIVSDRLHATIMSTLLGLPYIYLDNNYGKVTGYRKANFASRPSCADENMRARVATSWKEAVDLALEALDNLKSEN